MKGIVDGKFPKHFYRRKAVGIKPQDHRSCVSCLNHSATCVQFTFYCVQNTGLFLLFGSVQVENFSRMYAARPVEESFRPNPVTCIKQNAHIRYMHHRCKDVNFILNTEIIVRCLSYFGLWIKFELSKLWSNFRHVIRILVHQSWAKVLPSNWEYF